MTTTMWAELEADMALAEYDSELGSVLRYLAEQAQRAYRYFSTQKYGCYCGKGTECTVPIDNLDRCCQQHDRDYSAQRLNVSIDMWTPLGFRLSRAADLRLADCAARTRWDLHWYGPAAAAYREALIVLFRTRAWIAGQLEGLPACVRNNGRIPLWDINGLMAACP
jgi:hypothetical protein